MAGCCVHPIGRVRQQRSWVIGFLGCVVGHFGQHNRELRFHHRVMIALIIQNNGERLAPIPLTAEQPVAQPEVHGALAVVGFGQPFDCFFLRVSNVQAVKESTVHRRPIFDVRLTVELSRWLDSANDGQIEFLGELPVTLVLGRHSHDRAGAVTHETIVGDPNGDVLAGGGIEGVDAGEHAGLFFGFRHAIDVGSVYRLLDVPGQSGRMRFRTRVIDDLLHERMFRCNDHVRGTEDRVGARGKDAQVVDARIGRRIDNRKVDVRSFTAPDPLLLHGARRLGPIQFLKIIQ